MSRNTASTLAVGCPCVLLQLNRALILQWQKNLSRVSGLDKHAPFTAVKLQSSPQATLKRMESKRSRKEQLLPALLVLLSRPLLCADSRADFVLGCSHAERGEQEELGYTAGLCLLLLWPWFNHCRVTLYPGTLNEGRNVLTLSLLMEVKAKGVSVQREDRQPLNVRSSSSKPQLTTHSTSTVISKWLPVCDWSQRSSIHGARIRLNGISLFRCYLSWSRTFFFILLVLFHCRFHPLIEVTRWPNSSDSQFIVTDVQHFKMWGQHFVFVELACSSVSSRVGRVLAQAAY